MAKTLTTIQATALLAALLGGTITTDHWLWWVYEIGCLGVVVGCLVAGRVNKRTEEN